MEWKNIETAPKDGVKFLARNYDGMIHHAQMAGRMAFSLVSGSYLSATHWMPLPSPPETP